MKRKHSQIEMSDDEDDDMCQFKQQPKKRRLNDYHIQDNHDKITELVLNQQRMIEEFKKTIQKLNKKVDQKAKESNNKIYELEETVRKQQLVMREYMPVTTFKSRPSYFY